MLAPIPIKERLAQNKARRLKKEKVARGVILDRSVRAKYNKDLQEIANDLIKQTKEELTESIRRLEPEYIQDNYAQTLGGILETLTNRCLNISRQAKLISGEMLGCVN